MRGTFDVRKTRRRVFVRRLLLALTVLTAANILQRGGWSDVCFTTAGEPSRAAVAVDSGRLRATVKPLAPRVLAPKLANPASIAVVGK